MSFFQVGKVKNWVKVMGFLLTVSLMMACSTKTSKNVQTNESETKATTLEQESVKPIAEGDVKRKITAIEIDEKDDSIGITIQGNQKLAYTSIKQSFPFGIVVYLPETAIDDGLTTDMTQKESISDILVKYADKDQTTVKIEILLTKDLDYDVTEKENSLRVSLLSGSLEEENEVLEQKSENVNETTASKEGKPVLGSGKKAVLTGIEFNTLKNGKSDIKIETNHPIQYNITPGKNQILNLNLSNTVIPKHHKRPLLTSHTSSFISFA